MVFIIDEPMSTYKTTFEQLPVGGVFICNDLVCLKIRDEEAEWETAVNLATGMIENFCWWDEVTAISRARLAK